MKMTSYKLTIGGVAPRLIKNQKCRIECPDGTNLRSIYLGEAVSDDKPVFSIECETDVMLSGAMLYNFAERHRILFGERVILPNESGVSGVSGIPGTDVPPAWADSHKPLKIQAAGLYGTLNKYDTFGNKTFKFGSWMDLIRNFASELRANIALLSVITIVTFALGYAIFENTAGLYFGFVLAAVVVNFKSKIIEFITNKRK